jgi:dTDP-4-dehydrorhamnose reductase
MTKIAIFGANGLLGSQLCQLYPEVIPFTRATCDITNPYQVREILHKHRPNVVVNCAGLTIKSAPEMDHFRVNAYAPRLIAQVCDTMGIRMIHVSTDCVFNGDVGGYDESDYPTPIDAYGYSKALGEITWDNHLTVRCSFVGYPDPKRRSLLGWFQQQTSAVMGWSNALWNGITTAELSHILIYYANHHVNTNLIHIHGAETVSKYEMLKIVNDVYDWGKTIIPDPVVRIDRTLASIHKDDQIMVHKSFQQMIEEMRGLRAKFI